MWTDAAEDIIYSGRGAVGGLRGNEVLGEYQGGYHG